MAKKKIPKISEEHLDILIAGLQEYADKGVYDPWVLEVEGKKVIIQPLDVLKELKVAREKAWMYDDLCK